MTPPTPGTAIRSATELLNAWEGLMGEGGFGRSSLWLIFLDEDDRLQPPIMPIDDLPALPDDRVIANLARILGDLHEVGDFASAAMLLSRPGPADMTEADRRWARALRAGLGGISPWPMHLATRDRVQVFAPDDLIAA